MNSAVVLLASAVVGARNRNAFKNQASGFQLAVGVGHKETNKQTNKNASEQLVLIKGTLPQRSRYPFHGTESSKHTVLTAYCDCMLLYSL